MTFNPFTVPSQSSLVFRYDVNKCPACGAGIKKSKHLCFYMTGPVSGVSYLLCKRCGKESRAGLSPARLTLANERLEAFAVRAGLVSKEDRHA